MRSGVGGFHQSRPEPWTALTGLATQAFPSTCMVPRTHPCPRGQVLSTGEAPHVGSDLGQDHFSETPFDARNGFQPCEQFLIRVQSLSNLGTQSGNAILQLGEMLQVLRSQEATVCLQVSGEGLHQQLPFRAHSAARKLRHSLWRQFSVE